MLGNGAGSFGAATDFAARIALGSVAVGDLNGDGKQDLTVMNSSHNGGVSILLGNGAGSFGTATNFAVGTNPKSVAVGDFNGDGKQDLAVANWDLSNNISILLGNGAGSFGTETNFAVGETPVFIALGDFNGDGKQDLVVANSSGSNVSILLNTCVPGPSITTAPSEYIVKAGNTLFSIAKKFNVKLDALMAANKLTSSLIYPGQRLIIPNSSSTSSAQQIYIVQAGDTLTAIGSRYGTTVQAIKNANKLTKDTIYPGQKLIIP